MHHVFYLWILLGGFSIANLIFSFAPYRLTAYAAVLLLLYTAYVQDQLKPQYRADH